MAPRTLHIGPGAAQDPGKRQRGPQPGRYGSGGAQNSCTFSLHRVGRRQPATPKESLLTALEGNGEDEPFKFNDMATAAPEGAALWRGRVRRPPRRASA